MFPHAIKPLPQDFFANNRQQLLDQIPDGSAIIVAAQQEIIRNRDIHYPFHQDADFAYLTGFPEPDAILLLRKGAKETYTLFVRARDPSQETWHGRRFGPEGACAHFLVDQAFDLTTITEKLPELLQACTDIYYSLWRYPALDQMVQKAIIQLRQKSRLGINAPTQFHDLDPILHAQRLIKTPEELSMIQKACAIAVEAHVKAMAVTRPDIMEYHLASTIHHVFENYGGTWAYQSIIGSGENACILHYTENQQVLKADDCVLIDAGCHLHGYCSDITHTYPISGRMNGAQAALYEIVLEALRAATAALVAGQRFDEFHMIATRILTQGLVDCGILQGNIDNLIENKAQTRFFMHRTGHYLGRDVHDVGTYMKDGLSTILQNNMVITVEPGLYIPNHPNIPEAFRGIGVRLEDNIVVQDQQPINLTQELPRELVDIAQIIGSAYR